MGFGRFSSSTALIGPLAFTPEPSGRPRNQCKILVPGDAGFRVALENETASLIGSMLCRIQGTNRFTSVNQPLRHKLQFSSLGRKVYKVNPSLPPSPYGPMRSLCIFAVREPGPCPSPHPSFPIPLHLSAVVFWSVLPIPH